MRDYGKISPQFWIGKTGKKLRAAGVEAQIVSLYLMTSPHANMLGLYYCPAAFIAHETGLGLEGAMKGLEGAFEAGFCEYDHESEMVWVFEMALYQIDTQLKPKDNRIAGVQNEYDSLPDNPYLARFFGKYAGPFLMAKCRGSSLNVLPANEGAPKGLVSQEQEQEQKQEQEQTGSVAEQKNPEPKTFPVAVAPAPEKSDTELQAACKATWASYSAAYELRYQAKPVRNQKINALVKQFVQRIGLDESPMVADWFVSHPGGYYVGRMHDFGCLLSDAEKLRTEWVTGRVMTQAKARQSDRTGSNMSALAEILAERGEPMGEQV